MSPVRRFLDRFRWASANVLAGQHRFEEALRMSRAVRDEFKQHMEWRVFEIQQLSLLHWDHETINAANSFVLEYEYPTEKSEDRKYLLAYVKWCGAVALGRYAPESPPSGAFEFDCSTIMLDKVRARYKRKYPLTIHPSWDETSPFFPNNLIQRRSSGPPSP